MIAYGKLKDSSAIKLYMGAEGIDASIQNEVSKQLQEYDKAIKYCETDEEKEDINVKKFISKEYVKYVELSKPYQGIVIQKSAHPCAFLLLNGDIREEIGIIRCQSKSSKKSTLTTCIDGAMADEYKFLKTDLLIVDVVGLTEDIWKRIGKKSISNNELERIIKSEEGKKTWDIYGNGYTLCVNQCEQENTRQKCMKYKISSTAELSAFVAAIRPAFSSLLNNFLNRNPYSTGVKELDEVLKDSFHYLLYQESIMAYLNWLGIEMKETYDIIKKISKKKFDTDELNELKSRCKQQWIVNVNTEEGFEDTWRVMEDAVRYAFNSAHSYCVGNDGAEIAYLKAYYPYETYEVALNHFDKKKNKEKVSMLKQEMKVAFDINEGALKFGFDNRQFTLDKKNKCIHPCLTSIKNIGKNVADDLYALSQLRKFDNFHDLLVEITDNTSTNKAMLSILIGLDYFEDFGKQKKIFDYVYYFNILYGKKAPKKKTIAEKISDGAIVNIITNNSTPTEATYTKLDSEKCLKEIWDYIPDNDIALAEKIVHRSEILGYTDYKNENLSKRYVLVSNINTKYSPVFDTYCLNNGVTCKCKIKKRTWNHQPLQENQIIYIKDMEKKFAQKKVGEKKDKKGKMKPIFEPDMTKIVWWINDYYIVDNLDEVLNDDE